MNPTGGKALLEYFIKAYVKAEASKPLINRNKKVWGFNDMHRDLGKKEAEEVIDYFFEVYDNGAHDSDKLIATYTDLYQEMMEDRADQARLSKISAETAERVKQFGK